MPCSSWTGQLLKVERLRGKRWAKILMHMLEAVRLLLFAANVQAVLTNLCLPVQMDHATAVQTDPTQTPVETLTAKVALRAHPPQHLLLQGTVAHHPSHTPRSSSSRGAAAATVQL